MTVKSADFATLAPRLSHLEDLAEWLKEQIQGEEDGGEDGGDGSGLTDEDKKLWRAALLYSNGDLNETPWETETYYETHGVSLHACVFGLGQTRVGHTKNHSLYEQLFTDGDTRWSEGSVPLVNSTISTEAFGFESDGYTAALRANGWSLAQAIFREPSQIGSYPNATIVDKIDALDEKIQALDAKIEDLRGDLESFEAYVDGQIRRLDDRISSVS